MSSARVTEKSSNSRHSESEKSLLGDLPITVEPLMPTFEPRPQGVRTAVLLFANSTSNKLIFKVGASASNGVNFKICPLNDYIQPRESRMIRISITDPPNPQKEHEFYYETLPIFGEQGNGISAEQYWRDNNLDRSDIKKQRGKFICCEPEPQQKTSVQGIRRLTFEDDEPVTFNFGDSDDEGYPQKQPQNCSFQKTFSDMMKEIRNIQTAATAPVAEAAKRTPRLLDKDVMHGFICGFLFASILFALYIFLKL